MKPDNAAALDFLRLFAPGRATALVAIDPVSGKLEGRRAQPGDEHGTGGWLAPRNGAKNLYFHVGELMRPVGTKAKKEDVKSIEYFWVDVDPRVGEDIEEERARIFAKLTDNLPPDVPRPTMIVDSGGGYQSYWKLEKPFQIDGDLAKASEAERYLRWLAEKFDADFSCCDVSHLMRLPGTLNIPNAKKLKIGRKPALTLIVGGFS